MTASLLLVAALLSMCGASFMRQGPQRDGANGRQSMLLAIVCWFLAVIFASIAAMAIAKADEALPLNSDVTPETMTKTACMPNWDKTVRPPVSYTNKVKRDEMDRAGIDWAHAREIELDHRIPLILGGAPRDPRNLWLQSWAPTSPWPQIDSNAHAKDALEVRLHHLVCSGQLPLAEAQRCIYADWRACATAHPTAH